MNATINQTSNSKLTFIDWVGLFLISIFWFVACGLIGYPVGLIVNYRIFKKNSDQFTRYKKAFIGALIGALVGFVIFFSFGYMAAFSMHVLGYTPQQIHCKIEHHCS